MRPLADYPIEDLKRVYRILHSQLPEHMELMDSELMHDLQRILQRRAREDGVDVSLHAQWAAWLNDGVSLRGV
ncbi:MAG TPA: hypothetical protein VKA50_08420 [Gammaproteobacteria bacterium]|nr:hypothetical protein [Gammaproteobacteria bacterium]